MFPGVFRKKIYFLFRIENSNGLRNERTKRSKPKSSHKEIIRFLTSSQTDAGNINLPVFEDHQSFLAFIPKAKIILIKNKTQYPNSDYFGLKSWNSSVRLNECRKS